MDALEAEIRQRIDALLQRLESGEDLPPGLRLRLEGLLEAAVLTGLFSERELQQLLNQRHGEIRGATLDERLGKDWPRCHSFPEIPFFMNRAPVTPSTSD